MALGEEQAFKQMFNRVILGFSIGDGKEKWNSAKF